jgi:hypothetical protein
MTTTRRMTSAATAVATEAAMATVGAWAWTIWGAEGDASGEWAAAGEGTTMRAKQDIVYTSEDCRSLPLNKISLM